MQADLDLEIPSSSPQSPLPLLNPRPAPDAQDMTLCQMLNTAKSSLADMLDDPVKHPWVRGQMRADVVDHLTSQANQDPEFKKHLAMLFTLDHPDAQKDPAQHCNSYLSLMRHPSTFGGEPELYAAAQLLSSPIIVFTQTPENFWRLSNHLNNEAQGLPLFLFHSNAQSRFSAHYDYALPATPSTELLGGYGKTEWQ